MLTEDAEHFSLIMLALIILILLYSYIGNWLEHREVHLSSCRYISSTKREWE